MPLSPGTLSSRRKVPLGLSVFLSFFVGVGVVVTVLIAVDWLQGVRTYSWDEATCTIESSASDVRGRGDYVFTVAYRYAYRGQEYSSDRYRRSYDGSDDVSEAQRLAATYAEGSSSACWVDPDEPGSSYLRQANLWSGLWLLVPLGFVAAGGGSLWALHGSPRAFERPAGVSSALKKGPVTQTTALTLFFGLFFLVGAGVLIPFFVWPSLQVVQARGWNSLPCEIIESGVAVHSGDDGATYSIEVLYRYEVDGREILGSRYQFLRGSSSEYDAKAAVVESLPADATASCFVNPDDPFDAVLERGFTGEMFFGLIPALFMLIGAGGLVFALSTVRSAARTSPTPSWTPAPPSRATEPLTETDIQALSSGPVLLEPTTGRFGKLAVLVGITLFWNGIVAIFLWPLVESWQTASVDWFLALFLLPFVSIGLLLAGSIPFTALAFLNPRPRLRLSRGAMRAGESAMIEWTFDGAAHRIDRLRLWLESKGETGGIGRAIDSIEILDRGGQNVEFGTISFSIPDGATPTSEGKHPVSWILKLHGTIDNWPDVAEAYELRVLPKDGPWHTHRTTDQAWHGHQESRTPCGSERHGRRGARPEIWGSRSPANDTSMSRARRRSRVSGRVALLTQWMAVRR